MTERRVRIRRVVRPRPRDPVAPTPLDARDPAIVRVKERLYATGRSRRAA